jgi:hypothetical protein
VTIIPTYDTDALGYWVAEKEEELAENKIDLAPSASRNVMNKVDRFFTIFFKCLDFLRFAQ